MKLRNIFDRALISLSVFIMTTVPVYADGEDGTASSLLDKIILIFYAVFAIMGLFELIPGIGGMVHIVTNGDDDPQAKKKAQNQIIRGVVFLAIPTIIAALGVADMVKTRLAAAGL